jgi:hypothetical protein
VPPGCWRTAPCAIEGCPVCCRSRSHCKEQQNVLLPHRHTARNNRTCCYRADTLQETIERVATAQTHCKEQPNVLLPHRHTARNNRTCCYRADTLQGTSERVATAQTHCKPTTCLHTHLYSTHNPCVQCPPFLCLRFC